MNQLLKVLSTENAKSMVNDINKIAAEISTQSNDVIEQTTNNVKSILEAFTELQVALDAAAKSNDYTKYMDSLTENSDSEPSVKENAPKDAKDDEPTAENAEPKVETKEPVKFKISPVILTAVDFIKKHSNMEYYRSELVFNNITNGITTNSDELGNIIEMFKIWVKESSFSEAEIRYMNLVISGGKDSIPTKEIKPQKSTPNKKREAKSVGFCVVADEHGNVVDMFSMEDLFE